MRRTMLATGGLLIGALAMAQAGPAASDPEAAKEAIRKADLALGQALAERNREAFRALLAEDVVSFPGSTPARGPDAFLKNWEPLFADPKRSLTWRPEEVHVSASGDLGYSIGSYERAGPDPDGKFFRGTGTYVSIWKKQPNGSWKLAVDIGTPPAPKEK